MTAIGDKSCVKVLKNKSAFPPLPLEQKGCFPVGTLVMAQMRLPISCTSSMACWLHEPAVSMATSKKISRGLLKFLRYFAVLLSAVCLAAAPCSSCEAQMRLSKGRCPQLWRPTPSISLWPRVLKSGRLPSCLRRPIYWFPDSWDLCSFNSSPYGSLIWLYRCCLSALIIIKLIIIISSSSSGSSGIIMLWIPSASAFITILSLLLFILFLHTFSYSALEIQVCLTNSVLGWRQIMASDTFTARCIV